MNAGSIHAWFERLGARLGGFGAQTSPAPEPQPDIRQKHMQHDWSDLGSALVGVHLAGTTQPGFLIGHAKPRRRRNRRI